MGRLAELTIALSLATDLGTGQPMEHGLRTCWLSLDRRRGAGPGCARRGRACTTWRCCGSWAARRTRRRRRCWRAATTWRSTRRWRRCCMARAGEGMRYFVRHLAEDLPLAIAASGRVVRALTDPGVERRSLSGHCEVGARLAARLGLADVGVRRAGARLRALGRQGLPGRSGGRGGADRGPGRGRRPGRRAVGAAGGWPAAAEVLAHRRGRAYDPAVVDALRRRRRAVAGRDRRRPVRRGARRRAGTGADDRARTGSTGRWPRWRTSPT